MNDYQKMYERLAEKVRLMFIAEAAYFKSGKDPNKLKLWKAIRGQVNEIVNPKKTVQAKIDWLAQ